MLCSKNVKSKAKSYYCLARTKNFASFRSNEQTILRLHDISDMDIQIYAIYYTEENNLQHIWGNFLFSGQRKKKKTNVDDEE